jgi:DNA-binding transcriptional regulator YhcF (GntR family)
MNFKDKKAIYLQIAELFLTHILKQKWLAEDKIPSVREMAVELEVNPNTVMRTYSYLQDLEIIYNKRGIGFFVAADGNLKAKELVKKSFIDEDIPAFFNTLKIINMSLSEAQSYFENSKNTLK